jgi:hypothetical protein
MPIKILLGKKLNINPQLEGPQKKKLVELLDIHAKEFAWDYT